MLYVCDVELTGRIANSPFRVFCWKWQYRTSKSHHVSHVYCVSDAVNVIFTKYACIVCCRVTKFGTVAYLGDGYALAPYPWSCG